MRSCHILCCQDVLCSSLSVRCFGVFSQLENCALTILYGGLKFFLNFVSYARNRGLNRAAGVSNKNLIINGNILFYNKALGQHLLSSNG